MPNTAQWRNQMEGVAYPFSEGNGFSPLPDGFLVDAILLLPQWASFPIYLKSLSIGAAVVGGLLADGKDRTVASFQVPIGQLSGGSAELSDPTSGISRGTLVFGGQAMSVFGKLGLGTTTFKPGQTSFEGGCVLSLPERSVASLVISEQELGGKLALSEGDGIRIVRIDANIIRLDAVGSTTRREQCCQPITNPMKKANDAIPDSYGNIQFVLEPFGEPASPADLRQVLRIDPTTNGIVFSLAK